jgi:threonine/homoserine/homoserine lactone efflux protein
MHPEILSIALFWFVTAYTPGPNNIVASYSGFNFGIKKTIPHILGTTLGFTSLVFFLTVGLINIFKLFPIIQVIIKYLGTLFLFYLAYKISFSKVSTETKKENPVKFIETFLFQYLNPKGVIVAIVVVSTYVDLGENYINYATQVIMLALIFSASSITLWTFIGKFLRKFATNEKFIKYFNYVMSVLLLLSIITFYI